MRILNRILPVGPRSVLFGAHCWFIHPFFVAWAWTKLYGFPRDIRLWVAFFVHDLGYLFQWCRDMDGEHDGERHPEWAARLMHRFDVTHGAHWWQQKHIPKDEAVFLWGCDSEMDLRSFWQSFSLYHSRYYAKRDGARHSPLCVADKLAVALEPWWLYLPRVILSGEIHEYMSRAGGTEGSKYNGEPVVSKYLSMGLRTRTRRQWHSDMAEYLRKWVEAHRDGREDTWTPDALRQN